MPVDRPTFNESWYRVADLRPRLRSRVQTYRQHFRGQMWHVLQDPTSNQFFRANEAYAHFVAMLDGQRTVDQVWRACADQLGDAAPTQGEVIRLLGQLYTSNLIRAELPPDAEGLFGRYRKRVNREARQYVTNLLFARIPLLDPDGFLERWVGVVGRLFTPIGAIVWAALIATALYCLAGRGEELLAQSKYVLHPRSWLTLYLCIWGVRILHELSHAFACKKFGLQAGGGEVHTMGIMFLVFVPLPYVDASSAWAFRSKWRRVVVGAGGMFVELAIAAVAAIVWSQTRSTIAYNLMFIASVSTLLFNGNPLLRYDGYYILSDLLEMPNLAGRSKDYLSYLVKRYVWSVRQARSTAQALGERAWFILYGIASTLYRVFIFAVILLFLTDRLPKPLKPVAVGFGILGAVIWLCVPLGKFLRYLATSGELTRTRSRAVATSAVAAAIGLLAVALLPLPNGARVQGVVEPVRLAIVRAAEDGFVQEVYPTNRLVTQGVDKLASVVNPDLLAESKRLGSSRKELNVKLNSAIAAGEAHVAQMIRGQLAALADKTGRIDRRLAALSPTAPIAGTWIAPDAGEKKGTYVRQGERIGIIASLDELIIRAPAGQEAAAGLIRAWQEGRLSLEIRPWGRPELELGGEVMDILPAGEKQLPSAALGYPGGGPIRTAADDPKGTRARERHFEIRIKPDMPPGARLWPGQRVVIRFKMRPRPVATQLRLKIQQLLQRKTLRQ